VLYIEEETPCILHRQWRLGRTCHPAQTERPHGTRECSLMAASSRIWPGSQVPVAQDSILNTFRQTDTRPAKPQKAFGPACGGFRVQGTASSPPSMV